MFVVSSRDRRIGPAKTPYLAGLGMAAALCLAGCGGSDDERPPTYETTGVVTHNGNPLEDAHVTYKSTGEPVQLAYATTDAEGRFTLTTFETGDGAVEGQHSVKIMKLEKKEGLPDPGSVPPGGPTPPPPSPKSLIPKRYANFETSGFTATVTPDGPNEATYELTN